MKYNSSIAEVAKLQIGAKTLEEAKEEMRLRFKGAMAYGKPLVFYMDKLAGKFKTGKQINENYSFDNLFCILTTNLFVNVLNCL